MAKTQSNKPMTRILLIEDNEDLVAEMLGLLRLIPDTTIDVCMPVKPAELEFGRERMPELNEVKRIIKNYDIILLDGVYAEDSNCEYSGRDIFPSCEGKLVLGISSDRKMKFGPFNFHDKWDLGSPSKNIDAPDMFLAAVSEVIYEHSLALA